MTRVLKGVPAFVLLLVLAGYFIPENIRIPVAGATAADWNHRSFWAEPWGSSGVHKGIDIFGRIGTPVVSTTPGIVLYAGTLAKGGKVVAVLGPCWRIHYFAHLDTLEARAGRFVAAGARLGTLGDSGNAKGKPPHLHYAIVRLIPNPLAMDGATQGYRKAFFINPSEYLLQRGATLNRSKE